MAVYELRITPGNPNAKTIELDFTSLTKLSSFVEELLNLICKEETTYVKFKVDDRTFVLAGDALKNAVLTYPTYS